MSRTGLQSIRLNQGRARGFTMIELMVTVAVVAILAAIAVPSFRDVIVTNKLSAQSNELLGAIQNARLESLKRNVRVTICQSSDGSTCASATTWGGWLVFADANKDGTPQAAEILRTAQVSVPVQLTESSNLSANRFSFRPDGMARVGTSLLNGTLRFCAKVTSPTNNARDVLINSGSRVLVEQAAAGASCTTPGNPAP